ncbi:MAG: epoxyqueuosine reductase QueH [Patescibacteria group bacterium]|jgi:hypothetical protein
MKDKEDKKILLHSCCAACTAYLLMELDKEGREVVLFFFNPNFSMQEHTLRLEGARGLSQLKEVELIAPAYERIEYEVLIAPYRDKQSIKFIGDPVRFERRCREILINLILERAKKQAQDLGIKVFTSSMLCSPYRDHNTIWDVGSHLSKDGGVEFHYKDFRKGYWMGRNVAKKYGFSIPAFCSDYLE